MHHHHGQGGAPSAEMSVAEKMEKLLAHWIRHNHEHTDSYRQWVRQAKGAGLSEVAEHLATAVELTEQTTAAFQRALDRLSA